MKLSPEMKQRMVDIICSGFGEMFVPAGVKVEVVAAYDAVVRLRVVIIDKAGRELAEICETGGLSAGDTLTILDVNRAFDITVER